MIKVAITGSIAMGKSTIVKMLIAKGYPVFDSDQVVQDLWKNTNVFFQQVKTQFPDCFEENKVHKKKLTQLIFSDIEAKKTLEKLTHPFVFSELEKFTKNHIDQGKKILFYDIPLLFEVKEESSFDIVIVVSCDKNIQVQRMLDRGLEKELCMKIIHSQMDDNKKRDKADFVIYTNDGMSSTKRQLEEVLFHIENKK